MGSSFTFPGIDKLYIVDTQSREVQEIFSLPKGSFSDGMAISRDNRTIYYPVATNEADLWLLSLP